MKFKKLPAIMLDRSCSVEAAMYIILGASVDHLQKNSDLFRRYSDPEALTQMRVGLRRIRVALRIFKPVLPSKFRKTLRNSIRHFGSRLGTGHDLDVLLGEYLSVDGLNKQQTEALNLLRTLVREQKNREYETLCHELDDDKFQDLLKQLLSLTDQSWKSLPGDENSDVLNSPIAPFARETIAQGAQHLRKMDGSLASLDAQGIHKLRRRVKKARYQIRFFVSLCDEKTAKALIDHLAKLQDCLGNIRDITENRRLLLDFLDLIEVSDYEKIMELDIEMTRQALEKFKANKREFDRLWQTYMDKYGGDEPLISV